MDKKEGTDKKAALEEAIELIEQAQELVDGVVKGMEIENNYMGYGRYGFDQLLGNGNQYDGNLFKIEAEIMRETEDD